VRTSLGTIPSVCLNDLVTNRNVRNESSVSAYAILVSHDDYTDRRGDNGDDEVMRLCLCCLDTLLSGV
jgi:hypothetical protein